MKSANPFFGKGLPGAGLTIPFSAKAALAFFLLVFAAKGVFGQGGAYYYCGVFQIDRTPEEEEKLDELPELITDQFGNRYFPEELLIDFTALQCIGSGHFALEFAGDFTAEEEQTICQVFTDISTLIISQQSGIPIRIQKEELEDDVLGQARAFWRDDNTFGGCGIENNLIWEHINTDADFGSALLQGYVTGVVSINSSLSGNTAWHTLDMDASGTSPNVQSDFMDLYSVVLHEALHMLGFASRISPDGTPRSGYYSTWDHFLVSHPDGAPLLVPFDDPDCCDAMQYNPVLNTPENYGFNCIGLGQEAVAFQFGANASDQATVWGEYPSGFFDTPDALIANTLSHINHDCDGGEYVMFSSIGDGQWRREVSVTEQNILCRLGYQLNDGVSSVCNEPACAVVVIDDNFMAGVDDWIFTISYEDILMNDVAPDDVILTVENCSPFAPNLTVANSVDNNTITIGGLLPGQVYTLCYTLEGCGTCDEGLITIYRILDGMVIPVGEAPPCGNEDNIVPWGDFEAFSAFENGGQGINNYFIQTQFVVCDPFSPGTNNTPGVRPLPVIALNQPLLETNGAYLAGDPANNESIFLPLSQPIFPGCSIDLSFQYLPMDNTPDRAAFIQVYGTALPPCVATGVPNCNDPLTSGGFHCIEDGLLINDNSIFWQDFGPVTWENNTGGPINFLIVVNNTNAASDSGGPHAALLDNIVAVQNCDNELTVTPHIISSCVGGIIVEYEVCLTGVSSTDVTLEVEELAIQGLEFGEGNEFENGAATITGLAPDECRTVALVLDASGSILGSGSQFAISVSPSGTQNTCIQGNLMADIVLENCIPPPPAFACPCTGANVRNIEAGAGTNLSALYGTGQGRLPVGTLSNTCLAVNGRLLINQDYTIEGSNIWMQPGASIAVENGAELTLNGNEIRGCEQMWRGISVEPGGHLIFEGNQIEDAQFAITARRGANMPIVDINNNIFNRNHVGIRIPPLFGPLPLAVGHDIQQNTFRCAGCIATDGQPGPTPLLPTFDPIAEWEAVSFAAITVDNYAADFNIGGGNLLPSGFSIEVERLRNGFILTSANVNVFNTRMYDLVGGDPEAIILTPGDRGIGIRAEQCPTVEVRSSHFEKAFRGIYSRRSNFDVRNTNFVDTHIGLLGWEGTNRFLTVNNCRFENYRFSGVNLAGYASPRRVEIIGSTFTSSTASWADVNAFGRAIQVSNSILDSDASTANKRIEQNIFQLDSRSHGIYLIQAAHYQVLNNTIEYTGAMPAANGAAYGIALLGGREHYVAENNDISAAGIVAGAEIRGIQLTGSTDNVICCNILDNTTVGVHVLGTCSSTHLRHTDINNHEFGLFCADGSLLGVQTNAGNQWLGMYGEESAVHLGSELQVADSRFFVELVDPFLPDNPAPFSPNAPDDWFRDFDGEASLCADDDNCAPPWEVEEEAPDETDIHAATGIYDGTDHGGYLNWESQRHLYAKLKANGSLLGHSPEIDAFYSWASGNNMGRLYEIQAGMEALYLPTESQAASLKGLDFGIAYYETEIAGLLAQLETSPNDASLQAAYQEALYQLAILVHSREELLLEMEAERKAGANALIAENGNLHSATVFEENWRTVNEVWLHTIAKGVYELTPQQFAAISPIAWLCPQQGGHAVFVARSLYWLKEFAEFNDAELCAPTEHRGTGTGVLAETRRQNHFEVYPNPAKDELHLKVDDLFAGQTLGISLADITGHSLQAWIITESTALMSLRLEGLEPGLYFLSIKWESGITETRRIVIMN